jgi:hypothetical protein
VFKVYTTGRLAARSDVFATIEDALRSAERRIEAKRSGQTVRLENEATGEIFDERGIAEIRKSLYS